MSLTTQVYYPAKGARVTTKEGDGVVKSIDNTTCHYPLYTVQLDRGYAIKTATAMLTWEEECKLLKERGIA